MLLHSHALRRRSSALAATAVGVIVATAACGSSSSTGAATGASRTSATTRSQPAFPTASASLGDLRISGAYVPQPASPSVAAAYFVVRNLGAPDTLMSASSTVSSQVGLHRSVDVGSTGKMIDVPSLPLPTGSTVEFKPGGYHLMMENPAALAVGEKVPVTLVFQHAGALTLQVPVVPLTASDDDAMSMPGMGS